MIPVTVVAGDTLSGIAVEQGASLAAVEAANPQIKDDNLIFAGQTVEVPTSGGGAVRVTPPAVAVAAPSAGASGGLSSSGGGLSDVPGVPSSFAACVAFRESTDGTNPAANGNVYGIIPASGINVEGASLAVQKQAFSTLVAEDGTAPWAPFDGC
jgi:LysM repeat protein